MRLYYYYRYLLLLWACGHDASTQFNAGIPVHSAHRGPAVWYRSAVSYGLQEARIGGGGICILVLL